MEEESSMELSSVSFAELKRLREHLGTKKYKKLLDAEPKKRKNFKWENKNRPREISSKLPVSYYRETIPVKKKINRDPRFDDLSGDFNELLFNTAYSFIDDLKAKEMRMLQKKLVSEKDSTKKRDIKYLLDRMKQQTSRHKVHREHTKKVENREQVTVKKKRVWFLKKSEQKVLQLAEKYQELKKKGKLKGYLKRKQKKNVAKQERKLHNI